MKRICEVRPDFVFAALTGVDKTSHSRGHSGPHVDDALRIVDNLVGEIRADAERRDAWDDTHVWVVSDHGHSPVAQHEDLAGLVKGLGFRTIAHPFVHSLRGEAAVMVSGNAMAHIYLDLAQRERPALSRLDARWRTVQAALLKRDSVDLMIIPQSRGECEIHGSRGRGHAVLRWSERGIDYEPVTGDPIGVGSQTGLSVDESYDLTIDSDYPDSLLQIARLSDSPRSAEIIVSASRDWDFRSKYEPIPHVSSHGALHRDHMLVPLLVNHPIPSPPRRTVDVMPSALDALGLTVPAGLDGVSFMR
jgi:arylsulfatase A-like enzyme